MQINTGVCRQEMGNNELVTLISMIRASQVIVLIHSHILTSNDCSCSSAI